MSLLTDNGIIRFYDGTVIAIESQQYSPDGLTNWESTFNPNDHISTLDGVTLIGGHKYKRVKHSGDTSYQLPYRIVPEDPVFRVLDDTLQYKLETEADSAYRDLLDMSTLQGADGEDGAQGIPGEGFHIDLYGYYTSRPDCTNSLNSSSCSSCNNTNSTNNTSTTFMSLGDGALVLTTALIVAGSVTVDGVVYTHFSNDLVTWTALSAGIVDFKARYLATSSSGAVYTDMRTENYYSTQGLVYVCVDGSWILHGNIATPSYMVGESAGSSNIGYMDNFVSATPTNFLSDTIGLDANGELNIAEQSIDETAFAASIVGDGLVIPSAMDPIEVQVEDFTGFGLTYYTSDADSEVDIQVDATALIGDGMTTQAAVAVDGESRNLFGVDVTELVNNDSGITAVAQVDTYYDLMINLGDGLVLDGDTPQAITIDVDDVSLMVDSDSIRIKPYTSATDGVALQHLNPDIIWANKGVGLDLANGLYARIDNSTIGYDGSGNLEIPLNAVTGDRLNDNTADNTKGLEVSNDKLTVKVDGSTIDFNGSGELEYIGLAGNVVTSIIPEHNGTPADTVRDDVTMNFVDGTGIDITLSSVAATDIVTIQADIDTVWLDARINSLITAGATVYWGVLEYSAGDSTTIESYITALNHVVQDTWYNNSRIDSTHGLVLRAVTGETYKVIVDANGNLDTTSVTL